MTITNRLADDQEPSVRGELMEQIPHIAMLCHEDKERLHFVVLKYLLPLVVKLLADPDSMVRKTSLATLLVLMEQGLLELAAVEETVCPVILMLTELENVEFQTEAVALMTKMAPLIGRAATEKIFLARFATLCRDPVFYVRKVCAATFGQFCSVVSKVAIERILLHRFRELCSDEIWGVRKACAEMFMSVACACTLDMRKEFLAPLFADLLADSSRWVKLAAFQTLGPFISTFADPDTTGLAYNHVGELVLCNPDSAMLKAMLERINHTRVSDCELSRVVADSKLCEQRPPEDEESHFEFSHHDGLATALTRPFTARVPSLHSPLDIQFQGPGDSRWPALCSEGDSFNTFQYWRLPIPDLPLDTSFLASTLDGGVDMDIDAELNSLASSLERSLRIEDKACVATVTDQGYETKSSSVRWVRPAFKVADNAGKVPVHLLSLDDLYCQLMMKMERQKGSKEPEGPPQEPPSTPAGCQVQSIVPQVLVDYYVSMTHPTQVQMTDTEISHHCAFSLPAVALTLGRDNWPLLRKAYEVLASDMQWKVRQTIASSIHELAVILGENLTREDLVPIFNGFIKDLDEVRIGALKHMADFFKLLEPAERNSLLPRLSNLLATDNEWNWRFRQELATQLLVAVPLFSPQDTRQYLVPLAIALLMDKVAAVRHLALLLVTELVHHVSLDQMLLRSLLAELAEQFAHSTRWSRRQSFALLCSHLVSLPALPEDQFGRDVLPHLLDLTWDVVPNVRLTVARTVSSDIMAREYFYGDQSPHYEVLMQALKRLQSDKDRDVRNFSLLPPPNKTTRPDVFSDEASVLED